MVFHHLNSADIVVADTVCGEAIFAAKKVGALNIELVDVFPLILYFAAAADVDARHTLQYVAYRAVLRLSEAADVVGDGVALLAYAVGLDGHLFEQGCSRLHADGERKCGAVKRN